MNAHPLHLKNIEKEFTLREPRSALGFLKSGFKTPPVKKVHALSNISFDILPGEAIGIIGKNGAGKSTLLNVIAGIYQPSSGTIKTHEHVVPVIGLARAFHDRLTMEENIYLCGSLLGLSKNIVKSRLNEILTLTEFETYRHVPLAKFSDGMRGRLAFSIGIFADPDILLLDEVTNTSDKNFIFKVEEQLKIFLGKKKNVLIASHDMDSIRKCGRVIWLSGGTLVENSTNVEETIQKYLAS